MRLFRLDIGRPKAFLNDVAASSAVEFAFLAPILITLMMGMAGYGIYFGASHSIQQIAADAARSAIAGLNEAERKTIATAFIRNNANGYSFVDPAKVTIDTHDSAADGSEFVVKIIYDASDLPIWHIFQGFVMPKTTITRQSIIRIGGM